MQFLKARFKKQTIILFLIAILILSVGSISAKDTSTMDSSDNELDMGLNDISIVEDSSNSYKSILSSGDEYGTLNEENISENNLENTDTTTNETNQNTDTTTNETNQNIENTDTTTNETNQNIDDSNLNANKTSTEITIKANTIEKGSNLTICLKDINGTGIGNEKLSIEILNKTYARETDSNGLAKFKINLPVNSYPVAISYNGSESHESSSNDFNIILYQLKTKINIANKSVVKERNLILELLDKYNNPLKNKNITITVNNKKYTNTSNKNGKANFKISLATGKYLVKAVFDGDQNYNKSSKNFTMNVYKLKSNFTLSKTSIIRGNYLYAFLKDKNGKAISKAKVTLKINGKTYTKTTDSKGRILHRIKLSPGYYTIKLNYNGGNSYLKRSQSFKIRSHNIKTKFVVANYSVVRGKYLIVYLKDSGNKNLSNKKVIFTYSKKSYTKTTDSNGKASLRLTKVPGTYTVKLQFNGYMGYLKSKRSVKIKILKNTTADITAKNQTKHLNGNKTVRYYIKLTDNNGNPIANETIELKVKCNNITTGSGNKISKKTIVLSSDNIVNKTEDKKLLNEMAEILREKGYKVIVSGIGPNYHVSDVRDYANVCVFSLVGGVDSGMFVDMASNYYQSYLRKNKNQFVLGCVSPPVYLNLGNMTWLVRAHDDDYSPKSFKGLYYPGKYFNKVTKLDYVYGADAEQLVNNFLKYAKKGKSIDLGQSTPKTTTTYKVTTSKNGNAYIDLKIGTYTITSSIVNSNYKVDSVTSTLKVVKWLKKESIETS